jgi:hypothetical protein
MFSVNEEGCAAAKPRLKKNAFNEASISATASNGKPFKGIWIPPQIQSYPGLLRIEKELLGLIDSLTTDKDACWGSTEFLASMLPASEYRTKHLLASLEERGFTIRIGRNKNILRVVHPALSSQPQIVKKWLKGVKNSGEESSAQGAAGSTFEGAARSTLSGDHYIEDKIEDEIACARGASLSSLSFAASGERPPSAKTPEEEKSFFPSNHTEQRHCHSEPERTRDVSAGNPTTSISGSRGAVGRNGQARKRGRRASKRRLPTEAEVIAYCVSLGRTDIDGRDRYLDFRAKGFPRGDWRAVIDRYNLRGWLPSQADGAQTEEESPEAIQQQKEAEEKERQQPQEEARRRKEGEQRRQEELERAYLQNRNADETREQWETRKRLEAEEQRKKEMELRHQRAEAEIAAKKKKVLEEARKKAKEWKQLLEDDRRLREERHGEYLRTKKDGEVFWEWLQRTQGR